MVPLLAVPAGFAAVGTAGVLEDLGLLAKFGAYLAFGAALLLVLLAFSRRTSAVELRTDAGQLELAVAGRRCACPSADLAEIALTHDGMSLRVELTARGANPCVLYLGGLMRRTDLHRFGEWLGTSLPGVPVTINGVRVRST